MTATTDEQRAFAQSIAAVAERVLGDAPPRWRPGEFGDDRNAALTSALAAAGWPSLAEESELLAFAGPAAIELGRRLAPIDVIDALLGGPLLAGQLVRYGGAGNAVAVSRDALTSFRVEQERPLPYGDAIGVSHVEGLEQTAQLRGPQARLRIDAWLAASVGYAAGVGEYALGLTSDYARQRRAFGTTLSALGPVQQLLADAATSTRGLSLLASDGPREEALAYAGPALCAITACCQQVTGAIGFTLEYPLQRAYRRARAMLLWSEATLDALLD
jgi:alkylation response protein AidB-like acyl-CoA dehydrogenase